MEPKKYTPSLQHWLYMFTVKAYQTYHSPAWGGNAYLYKKQLGYICCALLYTKPNNDWTECAAKRLFSEEQLPSEMVNQLKVQDIKRLDISELLLVSVRIFNKHRGDEDMKFNLFKMAQIAQTALNVADTVNATYNVPHSDNDNLSAYTQTITMTGNERAMSMARAAINQDWFDLAKLGFDALINLVSEDPLPYEDYLEAISQYVIIKVRMHHKKV